MDQKAATDEKKELLLKFSLPNEQSLDTDVLNLARLVDSRLACIQAIASEGKPNEEVRKLILALLTDGLMIRGRLNGLTHQVGLDCAKEINQAAKKWLVFAERFMTESQAEV